MCKKESYKDPLLEGFYVKRCKCGYRAQSDRCPSTWAFWLVCENCDNQTDSYITLEEAIENWNNNNLYYGQ